MNKNYVKNFQKEIWKMHLKTALFSVLSLFLLVMAADWASDGIFIDMLERRFGYKFAKEVLDSKYSIVVCIGAIIVIWNFLIVERYALKSISKVFANIGVMFKKDQQKLNFQGEFQELEDDLNHLKEERIRQEELVERDAQRRADMLAYLAHDIKTPLASVIGYLCLLDEKEDLPEELRKKYIRLTLEKANRMETLMNEFFDITRFNLGDIPLEKCSIDVSYMLAQMVDEFYPMLKPGNREAKVSAQPELYIYVDPDKTARVFNNILKNAISYSDENSVLVVQAEKKGKMAEISFENSGPEIPADTINSIFDKFYRVDTSRSSETGGAGLGLAIAKEIVEQHGGAISVSSASHKTKFTVLLPLSEEREKAGMREPPK